MGVEVVFFVKVRNGADLPENDSPVAGKFERLDASDAEAFAPANAVLRSRARKYDVRFSTSLWPDFCALLLYLLAHPDVEEAWYSDNLANALSETDRVTLEKVNALCEHHVFFSRIERLRKPKAAIARLKAGLTTLEQENAAVAAQGRKESADGS